MDHLPPIQNNQINSQPPTTAPLQSYLTQGLRETPKEQSGTALSERSTVCYLAENLVNPLFNTLETTTAYQVSKAFFQDFYATTANTFNEMYSSLDNAIPMTAKLVGGLAGFSAAVGQTMAAMVNGSDFITPLLAKGGINVVNITNDEIIQLSSSAADLLMGESRNLEINNARFKIDYPDYGVTISEIKLLNLTAKHNSEAVENEKLGLSADALSFKIEIDTGRGSSSTITLNTSEFSLAGETNLLSLVGMTVANYCNWLKSTLPPLFINEQTAPQSADDKQAPHHSSGWSNVNISSDEQSTVNFTSKGMTVKVEEAGDYLKNFGFTDDSTIFFKDFYYSQEMPFIKDGLDVSTAKVQLEHIELDSLESGPVKFKSGYLRLDEALNGEVVFTLQANFEQLNEFCPEWLPKSLRKSLTKSQSNESIASVRLGAHISGGVIDLNSLAASGLNEEGLTQVQKLLQTCLVDTLNSEKTRVEESTQGGELNIHIPFARLDERSTLNGPFVPNIRQNLFHKLKKKIEEIGINMRLPSSVSKVLIPENQGRGKLSLIELLKEHVELSQDTNNKL